MVFRPIASAMAKATIARRMVLALGESGMTGVEEINRSSVGCY